MNRNSTKTIRFLSLLLLITLIAAMALSFASCDNSANEPEAPNSDQTQTEATLIGEGANNFLFRFVVCVAT